MLPAGLGWSGEVKWEPRLERDAEVAGTKRLSPLQGSLAVE
jgi:hypothetical protein